jgi:hypothetical protein
LIDERREVRKNSSEPMLSFALITSAHNRLTWNRIGPNNQNTSSPSPVHLSTRPTPDERSRSHRSIRHEASSTWREYTVEGLQLVGNVTALAGTAWAWSQLQAAFPQVSASPMQVFHGCLQNLLRLSIEE